MSYGFLTILALAVGLAPAPPAASGAPAAPAVQERRLPVQDADKNITKDTLSNGLNYYFCKNSGTKGNISFALVQKTDPAIPENEVVEIARRRFSKPIFHNKKLEEFLACCGIVPSKSGYFNCKRGSITYTFDGFSSVRSEAKLDSLLFALFSIAADDDVNPQPTHLQALIVAGDFNQESMLARMNMASILVPKVPGDDKSYDYSHAADSLNTEKIWIENNGATSKVSVQWTVPRLPEKYINSVLPLVATKLVGEFGQVMRNRLYHAYRASSIPVHINYNYIGSTNSFGDATITLSVNCMSLYGSDVKDILATELDRVATWGIDGVEYLYARDSYRYKWMSRAMTERPSNLQWINRCKASFLYGSSLSSDSEQMTFAYKPVPEEEQVKMFNKVVSRLLSQTSRVNPDLGKVPAMQSSADIEAKLDSYKSSFELKLPKKDETDYVTGGLKWTLSSGVVVIYRKCDTKGYSYYSYSVRGGRRSADADYLSSIDGIYPESLKNYLQSKGIEQNVKLRPTDIRIYGKAPSSNIEKVFSYLGALSAQKENAEVFSSKSYKLLVIAGDIETDVMKSIILDNAAGLGYGGKWMRGTAVSLDDVQAPAAKNSVRCDVSVKLGVSAHSYALHYVIQPLILDQMALSNSDAAVRWYVKTEFDGFPSENYRVQYGLMPVKTSGMSDYLEKPTLEMTKTRLSIVFDSLLRNGLSDNALKMYRQLAKNEFASACTTAEYYLFIANNRYMDNRNLHSAFNTEIDSITKEEVMNFIQAICLK